MSLSQDVPLSERIGPDRPARVTCDRCGRQIANAKRGPNRRLCKKACGACASCGRPYNGEGKRCQTCSKHDPTSRRTAAKVRRMHATGATFARIGKLLGMTAKQAEDITTRMAVERVASSARRVSRRRATIARKTERERAAKRAAE